VNIRVSPASCVGSLSDFIADYFLTSYSYSKDNLGTGQETWALTSKPDIPGFGGTIVMLRGIPEGTIATGAGIMTPAQMGVAIDEIASNDSFGAPIEGDNGSVQAGTPGIGNYDVQRYIIPTAVGGSIGKNSSVDGYSGAASVSIQMNPIYL